MQKSKLFKVNICQLILNLLRVKILLKGGGILKRLSAFILSVCLVLGSGFSALGETSGDYTYSVSGEKATITAYSGTASTLKIPSSIDGFSVTAIGDGAFAYNNNLKSVTVPKTVTKIGEHPFYECRNLTEIKVNSSNEKFTDIDGVLFTKIKTRLVAFPGGREGSYTFPETVKAVSPYAFAECDNLVSVTTSEPLYKIEEFAFAECDNLKGITFKQSLLNIYDGAFFNCKSLSSISLPASVENVDWAAFYNCKKLKTANVYSKTALFGTDVFGECENVSVYCYAESTAWEYAEQNGINLYSLDATKLSSKTKISGTKTVTYTGEYIKFDLSVTHNGKKLVQGTDYTVEYKNNKKPGVGTVSVKGIKNYIGTKSIDFKIKPKTNSITGVSSPSKRTIKVKYSTYKLVSGYQVQYSSKSSFSSYKYVFVNKNSTSTATMKTTLSKKYYYVRVRSFKTVDGKRIYSSFSKSKKVYVK